jgi:hypothetical protein
MLLTTLTLAALALMAMLVIHHYDNVAVDVVSCFPNGRSADVVVHYRNRLSKPVTLSFDVALARTGTLSKYGLSGIHVFASKHESAVVIPPNTERDAQVSIDFPPRVSAADAVILNLNYEN